MAQFSEFLYALRKERNMTQSELAAKLGITNKAVSKWETGEAMPDTAQLFPLAQIFGVTVDELLRGERNAKAEEPMKEQPGESVDIDGGRIRIADGKDTVEISSHGVFVNGVKKEHYKQTFLEKISGCVCGSLMAIALIVYVSLGCFLQLWDSVWWLLVCAALSCGIIGGIFDLCNREKNARRKAKGKNPYTDSICGIVICASLIIYFSVAAACNLWNIMWIVPVAGVCACIVIGTVGNIFTTKNRKD